MGGGRGLREKMKTAYLWMLWTPWCVDVMLAVVVVEKLICLWVKGVRDFAGDWGCLMWVKAVVASLVDLL